MFVGESIHTVDAKGRVFVPKKFQEVLDEGRKETTAVLTRGFEGCLFLFSSTGFEGVLQRLLTQAFGGAELRKMQRLFFANTHRCQLDSSGRLLIPEKLRQRIGLEKEVVFVGVAERAELWSRERWEAFEAENDGEFDQLDAVLCGDPTAVAANAAAANGGTQRLTNEEGAP